jgi:hypothetical protein
LKSRIRNRGVTPYHQILQDLSPNVIIKDLKHVAKDNKKVRELNVSFVRNRHNTLGDERTEDYSAVQENPVMDADEEKEDERVPMVLRARSWEEIVAEIGTARSRRVERAMRRAEESRLSVCGSEAADGECGSGHEVWANQNRKRVWVEDTMVIGVDDLRKRKKRNIEKRGGRLPN